MLNMNDSSLQFIGFELGKQTVHLRTEPFEIFFFFEPFSKCLSVWIE